MPNPGLCCVVARHAAFIQKHEPLCRNVDQVAAFSRLFWETYPVQTFSDAFVHRSRARRSSNGLRDSHAWICLEKSGDRPPSLLQAAGMGVCRRLEEAGPEGIRPFAKSLLEPPCRLVILALARVRGSDPDESIEVHRIKRTEAHGAFEMLNGCIGVLGVDMQSAAAEPSPSQVWVQGKSVSDRREPEIDLAHESIRGTQHGRHQGILAVERDHPSGIRPSQCSYQNRCSTNRVTQTAWSLSHAR